jgi:glycosyltransferase involved in cell wall biosynthesis
VLVAGRMSGSRVRLLYLQPAPLFGGAERQAAEQASYLPEFGVDVTVMAGPGQAIIEWLEAGHAGKIVRSENFPGGGPPRKGLRRVTLPYHFIELGLRARAQIKELVAEAPCDVILASLPFAWITGSVVARELGVPIAWRAGGYYLNAAQIAGMWGLTHFLRPDLLICNAKSVADTFHPLIPAPLEILPNGVDMGVFNPHAGRRARFRPPNAQVVIGFAGRLATAKRPEDVLALAARLRESTPEARVLIAGEGTRRPDYEALARELGADNVGFLGYVADMPSFYAACDIIVLPSRSEGSSNMLLEAMACGKPVVASDIPPLREQLDQEHTGLTYPLGDVEELARLVRQLIAEPNLRRELSERGLRAASRASARVSAEKLALILKRLVAEADAKRSPAPIPLQAALATAPTAPRQVAGAGTLAPRIHAASRRGTD